MNLGGSIDILFNARGVVELAVGKGATPLLMLVSARRRWFDRSDDRAAKIDGVF
mgnify:CR=1 FL=1